MMVIIYRQTKDHSISALIMVCQSFTSKELRGSIQCILYIEPGICPDPAYSSLPVTWTDQQILAFGFVKQIKVRRNGVMIYPEIRCYLPQQRLNEALFELDITGTDSFNEFNRMHWSIKKIDLIAELQELGFNL